ncbi:MAG: metallophosphoesterase [Planctomycetes bacterium]|nr:metallophosphoesterase [Planctomycetota bacterium]
MTTERAPRPTPKRAWRWPLAALLACCATLVDAVDTVTRGPYLQMQTATGMVVRWRTNNAVNGRVRYGTVPGSLTLSANQSAVATDHEVALSALTPATRYYYSVGTSAATIVGDATYTFVTAPTTGTPKPTRVWVLGDAGTGNSSQTAVRDAYLAYAGTTPTDLWLMLGDNAYNTGLDSEYQTAVFNLYPVTLRQSALWPTLGNHDTAQSTTFVNTYPYFDIFTLPTAAQAGGVASGTEHYYSFDYGNIHWICLDSMTADRSPGGAMLTWLTSDLGAATAHWIIAFWHHPPYTKGSHDSDTETPLIEMRTNALPILEAGGVDLVLSGHSHSYERSYLLDGHYGVSSTLAAGMKINGGSGASASPYTKLTGSHRGAVYAVAGSSGQIAGGTLNHPAMYISLNNLGSMVLDVHDNRIDGTFLRETGAVADAFTIEKETPPRVATPANAVTPVNGSTTPVSVLGEDDAGESNLTYTWSTVGSVPAAVTFAPNATNGAKASTATFTAAGTYILQATITDQGGNSVTSSVTVNVTGSGTAWGSTTASTGSAGSGGSGSSTCGVGTGVAAGVAAVIGLAIACLRRREPLRRTGGDGMR